MSEQEIFQRALVLPAVERLSFVARECGDDAALRARVEALLAAYGRAGEFLESPAAGPPETIEFQPLSEGPGGVIGPYKLLQKIGEGGFGVVFMAEQEHPVRRQVALKIIKAGMDTREVIARFESERQALAIMDHPHIAKVLDAGATTSGRPYFVMELVKGVPITEFCDRNHLPAEGRLKLFIDVCHAIQHAHHKGIIHRDVKPGNVLVTLHDGTPVVKVIDFGVAKATIQKLTERTLFTAFGQMVGTPVYMSPEQAEMSGLDIDTRTDVYSLGVLLYELLTGTTPLDIQRLRSAGYAEMQRLIREEEPPTPSHRISSLGDSATILAGNRGTDARKLSRLLSGDLDCLVLKSLEKDRNRRYATPSNFAEDIHRYLHREPIQARPASALYKLKKFTQRNRVAVATAVGIVLLLLAGITGTTWGLIRAERRRIEAVAEKKRAEEAEAETLTAYRDGTDDAIQQLLAEKAELGPSERAYLEKTLKRWQAFAERQGDDERSLAIQAEGHFRVARLLQDLGHAARAKAAFEAATRAYGELVRRFPSVATYSLDLAMSDNNLGGVLLDLGKREEAWLKFDSCRKLLDQLDATSARGERAQFLKASNCGNRAIVLKQQEKFDAALVEYQTSLEILLRLAQQFPDKPNYRRALATLHVNVGLLLLAVTDFEGAATEYHSALEIQEALRKELPQNSACGYDVGDTRGRLADLLTQMGKLEDGLQEYKSACGILEHLVEHLPGVAKYVRCLASNQHNYAKLLRRLGRTSDAQAVYEAARNIEQRLVEQFPEKAEYSELLGQTQVNLGNLLRGLNQDAGALTAYQEGCATWTKLVNRYPQPSFQRALAGAHNGLGLTLMRLERRQDAKAEYEAARTIQEELAKQFPGVTEYDVALAGTYCNFANLLVLEGQPAESLKWFDQAIEMLKKADSTIHESQAKEFLAISHRQRAGAYGLLNRPTEALQDWDRAIELSPPSEQEKMRAVRPQIERQKWLKDITERLLPGTK